MGNNRIFQFWINSSMRDFHVILGVISVVLQIIGKISKNPQLPVLGDITALFAILHFFVHGYFHRQQRFLTDNQRVYSLPKKKIAATGALYLTSFMAAVIIGMAVVRELYSGTLFAKVKAMFVYLLGLLLGALFESDGLGRDELLMQDSDILGAMNQVAKKADSPWENLINSIQTVLIIAGIIFLVVLCIALIVNYVKQLFNRTDFHIREAQGREVQDREETIRDQRTRREKFLDFSPAAKIRRTYRRCIKRHKRAGQTVPEWMTPAEIESMVLLPEKERYLELHEIYEKARYSESGCTEEDVKRIKTLKV